MQRLVATILFSALPTIGCSQSATPAGDSTAPRTEISMSYVQALSTAAAEVPNGIPVEIELEEVDGQTLLEVEFIDDGGITEVYLDPQTGDVVKVQDEKLTDEGKAAVRRATELFATSQTITLDDAIARAQKRVEGGQMLEAEYGLEDDQLELEIDFLVKGELVEVQLHPISGEILSVDTKPRNGDDDDHDDDHDGDDHDDDDHDDE